MEEMAVIERWHREHQGDDAAPGWWRRAGRADAVRLPALLLVAVGLTHYGYEFMADAMPGATPAAVFYVLLGIEGTLLFTIGIAWAWSRGLLVIALICAWGAIEEAQTAVCRIGIGLAQQAQVDRFSGLCGWPAYAVGVVIMGALAALVAKGVRDE